MEKLKIKSCVKRERVNFWREYWTMESHVSPLAGINTLP